MRRRKPGRGGEPRTTGELMDKLIGRLGGPERVAESQLFPFWGEVVGAHLAGRTQPDRLRGGVLYVTVASSAVAHEIGMLKHELIGRLANRVGAGLVQDIRTRVNTVHR